MFTSSVPNFVSRFDNYPCPYDMGQPNLLVLPWRPPRSISCFGKSPCGPLYESMLHDLFRLDIFRDFLARRVDRCYISSTGLGYPRWRHDGPLYQKQASIRRVSSDTPAAVSSHGACVDRPFISSLRPLQMGFIVDAP